MCWFVNFLIWLNHTSKSYGTLPIRDSLNLQTDYDSPDASQ